MLALTGRAAGHMLSGVSLGYREIRKRGQIPVQFISLNYRSQIVLRLHFDANSELGYCGTIREGNCPACPLLPPLVPKVSHSWWPGTELAWESSVPQKQSLCCLLGYFAGRSLHSSGPLEGFRNVCPGTQAAEEVGETGLLLPTHTASLTYLDYSPNCILGTNENLGMGFRTSPFLPCLAPGFANRWRVPLKWMHRFPFSAELRERQGAPALTGSETFFVQVSWAAGKPRRSHEAASHTCSGGDGVRRGSGWSGAELPPHLISCQHKLPYRAYRHGTSPSKAPAAPTAARAKSTLESERNHSNLLCARQVGGEWTRDKRAY